MRQFYWILSSLVLSVNFVFASLSYQEKHKIIEDVMQEKNDHFFLDHSMQVATLKNYPETIPILVDWMYQKWHPYDRFLTKEKLSRSFRSRLHDDRLPMTFVVLKNNQPIAMISLKQGTSPECSDASKKAIWGGSFLVVPEERGKGIGIELGKLAISVAKKFGYECLYFYTSDTEMVPWYVEKGACILEKKPFRDHEITVMKISTIKTDKRDP